MNTAGNSGGALFLLYGSLSLFDSSLLRNTAGKKGGGIYIRGDSASASELHLQSAKLQSNKQIGGGTWGEWGGGGLYLAYTVTANIR